MKDKSKWLILGVINVLVILFCATTIYCSHQDDVVATFSYLDENNDELTFVYSTPEMKKGVYEAEVKKTGGGQYILTCDDIDWAKGSVNGERYPAYYMDEHVMSAGWHDISFRLWINSDIDYLRFRFTAAKPVAELDIESIVIKRSFRETFTYFMLRIFAMLLAVNGAIIAYWNRQRLGRWLKKNIYIVLGLLAILGISALPVFMDSLVCGHDIPFHLSRITGLAEGLATGQMPVRIQPGWNNDYGYAVSVFYGDVLLYLPAVLYLFGVPLLYAYHIYLLIIHLGTVGIAYYSYHRLCGDRSISLFCTAFVCLSVNRILNVYIRSAVGEYSAYMFLPLVILGMKEILCGEENNPHKTRKNYAYAHLGIGMAGILQSHIVSFEMVCLLLGLVVLLQLKNMLCRNRILTMLKTVFFSIGLSAWFLVPFLDYARQELQIFQEKYVIAQGFGLTLYELFSMPTQASGAAIMSGLGLSNRFPVSLGISVIFIIMLEVVVLAKLDWEKTEKRRLLFVSGMAGVCIWMATIYFPWNRCGRLPGLKDIASSIQYPWRFLSLAIPILGYAASLVLVKIKSCIPWNRTKYLILFLCGITALQGMYVTDLAVRDSEQGIYDGSELLRQDRVLIGGEYLFTGVNREQMQEEAVVSGENVEIVEQTRNGNTFYVTCNADAGSYLEFPLLCYQNYKCRDEQNDTEFMITQGTNHKIRVEFPANYQGTLKVFFEEPWYWRAAEAVSLLTLLSVCVYGINIIIKRRKSHGLTD